MSGNQGWTYYGYGGQDLPEPVASTEKTPQGEGRKNRRCCGMGLSRRAIWGLIAIVVLVVLAGAVGGAVGGILGSQNSSSTSESTSMVPESSSTIAPSLTLRTSATITTSTIVGPLATRHFDEVYRDCPSSNNSIYTTPGPGDSTPFLFRKMCGQSFPQGPRTSELEIVMVNQPARSLDDCIGLCIAANTPAANEIGRGDSDPCNTVCWRNASPGDDHPYQCFGGHSTNSTDGYTIQEEIICDSALWINA